MNSVVPTPFSWDGSDEDLDSLIDFLTKVVESEDIDIDDPFKQDKHFTEPLMRVINLILLQIIGVLLLRKGDAKKSEV